MNDQAIEQEIQAKGLTAPRVTLADIDANIVSVEIVKHQSAGGQILRWAVLTTVNGYAVTGRPAVAVSPENDNAELGEKIALDNARNELWPLMGYELRERLYREERGDINQYADEQLRWHGQLRNDLMDVLGEKDPANILGVVRAMKYRLDSLSK